MENIKNNYTEELKNINSEQELNELKAKYIGKKGEITMLYSKMKEIPNEEKKAYGMLLNDLKNNFNELFIIAKNDLETKKLNEKLETENIDISLPGLEITNGAPHILEKVIEDLEEFYISMGYTVEEGPEVEKDLYNFEMLNLPKGHSARDAQDTFYIKDEEMLLRSQTSPVQIRTMLKNEEKKPFKMICPGKTYRRDVDDATHSHQFTQMEGMVVAEEVSLSDLKGTLELMAKHLFGEKTKTRFRSSYYPFTEPSVEFDVTCVKCGGKGCNVCKDTGWLTIGGAGMVHPKVLLGAGFDPEKYMGFAFGFGIERIAMVKYEIDDVR